MLSKMTSKIFSMYLSKKGFGAQYFALIYIVKNKSIIPPFPMRTKVMKCDTVRYIKISIPKCYLGDFPETRTSSLSNLRSSEAY